jgi:hypothetical protein
VSVVRFRRPRPANPANWCSGCGEDFTSVEYFDRHRVGEHELDWPEHENGRRCLSVDELAAIGFQRDQRGRWLNPARAQRAFSALGGAA